MKYRLIRHSLFTVFALVLLVVPAANAQTPPKGDNVAAPVNLPLNKHKTIKNAQFATMEGIGIEAATCDGDNSSDHSVWFRFTMPRGGMVDIDSGGTILNSAEGSHSFVVLSLHQQDAGFTELDCVVSTTARFTGVNLPAGIYLVRIANDSVNEPTGPSQYRVSIRLRFMSGMIENSSFENSPLGVHWKIGRAGSPPKVTFVCLTSCGVRFGGAAGGKVLQNVSFDPKQLKYKVGDVVSADAFINNTGVSGANVRMMLKISYSDGRPKTVVKQTRLITQTGTTTTRSFGGIYAEIASKAVSKIQLTVMSPAVTDTFTVDSASLNLRAGTSVREQGLLPVPPPPAGQ
jgi:hypothetical protein